jgi:hypothetical protein
MSEKCHPYKTPKAEVGLEWGWMSSRRGQQGGRSPEPSQSTAQPVSVPVPGRGRSQGLSRNPQPNAAPAFTAGRLKGDVETCVTTWEETEKDPSTTLKLALQPQK